MFCIRVHTSEITHQQLVCFMDLFIFFMLVRDSRHLGPRLGVFAEDTLDLVRSGPTFVGFVQNLATSVTAVQQNLWRCSRSILLKCASLLLSCKIIWSDPEAPHMKTHWACVTNVQCTQLNNMSGRCGAEKRPRRRHHRPPPSPLETRLGPARGRTHHDAYPGDAETSHQIWFQEQI